MPLPVNAPQTHVLRETQEEVKKKKKEGEQITSACAALSGRCFGRPCGTVGGFSHTWEPGGSCSCPVCLDYPRGCKTTDPFFGGVKHGDSGCGTEKVHQEGALDGRGRCPEPHSQRGELGGNRRARCVWTRKDRSEPPCPHTLLCVSPPLPSFLPR